MRLKARFVPKPCLGSLNFQYLKGAIEGDVLDAAGVSERRFQYLKGAIEGGPAYRKTATHDDFQYLKGAIEGSRI